MSAILFGSISTLADTSELQREAFNEAFRAHGLDWTWDREDYRAMLATSGGQSRVAQFADAQGQTIDVPAVHASKSAIFQEKLASAGIVPRPGVEDTIRVAKDNGWKLGLVTTTSSANLTSLLDALSPAVRSEDFDVIIDVSQVENPKPDKAAYAWALEQLGESSDDCVAVEDNADGVTSAVAAGLRCVALPNENTATHDLHGATDRVDRLDPVALQRLVTHN